MGMVTVAVAAVVASGNGGGGVDDQEATQSSAYGLRFEGLFGVGVSCSVGLFAWEGVTG
jgi:hypothetical protein